MRRLVLLAALGASLMAAAAQSADRYTPPGGAFSVASGAGPDRAYTTGKEQVDAGHVFVVLNFDPGTATHGAHAERTIVWNATTDLIAAPDVAATGLVTNYLVDRFPHGGFAVTARRSARTADGQLYRVFEAKGSYKDVPALWQGIVLFFPGKGVALLSEVYTLNGEALRAQLGLGGAETAAWATSFRPEK